MLLAEGGEDLLVAIQGGDGVAAEDAFVDPAAKLARRFAVLLLRISLREIDADGSEDEVFERASAALSDLRGGASSAGASGGARP